MALVYAGGTYVNTTFTGDTIAHIITALETQLVNAGWSVISGSGTTNVLFQSATQSGVTNPIRVRVKTNSGTCAAVSLENQAGTLASTSSTTAGGLLLPVAAQTMRVIATKYWFCCFVPGSAAARTFVYAGMPYVDSSFLTSVTDIGVMFSNCFTEASAGVATSFRSHPAISSVSSSEANYALIYNTSLLQNNNTATTTSNNSAGAPDVLLTCAPAGAQTTTARNYRWANDDLVTSDVLVGWGLTSTGDEAKIRGQFFDMVYVAEAATIDTSSAFPATGHTFYNLTNNFTQTTANPRGGMWVRTDT